MIIIMAASIGALYYIAHIIPTAEDHHSVKEEHLD
jgi:hypothetical protein